MGDFKKISAVVLGLFLAFAGLALFASLPGDADFNGPHGGVQQLTLYNGTGITAATFTGAAYNVGAFRTLIVHGRVPSLTVTSTTTGTPYIELDLEESVDGTNWVQVDKMGTAATTNEDDLAGTISGGETQKKYQCLSEYVRVKGTLVGGTGPTATVSVKATGKT